MNVLLVVRSLGNAHIIQSAKGVFWLDDDLSIEPMMNFPFEQPWPHETSIDYVDAWQTYTIVDRRSGTVFVSNNMRDFSSVASTERITKLVGILPKPASVLMVGESRLFAITEGCVQ